MTDSRARRGFAGDASSAARWQEHVDWTNRGLVRSRWLRLPTDRASRCVALTGESDMGTILIDKLLQACVKQGASDIHIVVGQPPVFRLHGRMRKLETKVLEPDDTVALMKSIAPDRCQQELQETGSADFGFAFGDLARFRVSIFKQRGNVSMVLRQIPNKMLTPEQLGLPRCSRSLIMRPRGLFLVTGPTGSGKSTTLASLVNYINENVDHHIITIEDPIEFYHYHKKSTINQREVGVDVPTSPKRFAAPCGKTRT